MNDNDKPLGERIRDLINPALEDSRREKIQSAILDSCFEHALQVVPMKLEAGFTDIFNRAAHFEKKSPEKKNPLIIEDMTWRDPMTGEEKYSPVIRMQLPISVAYTTFSADEVKELPGYIRMHEMARDLDVSVRVFGLLAEEKSGSPYNSPPLLIFDASKTYEEGALENANLYPNLPPKAARFDKKASGEFKF